LPTYNMEFGQPIPRKSTECKSYGFYQNRVEASVREITLIKVVFRDPICKP